jgi:hypothetical protein
MEEVQKCSIFGKLSVVKGEAGESVPTKLQAGLRRNPGFSTFSSVCQVLNGDNVNPPEGIAPEKIPLLKYAPVPSCDVESSFYQIKENECPQKIWKGFPRALCIEITKIVPKGCK